ncbi:hypothetical protein HMPREF0872_03385 [Veillonella montpellierensis DNF00314]|uniref:Uncharacterized protein n=1 Tax=Veillonella montpellierensis DNF00314 TaxID=1401067 RepID=A0A096AKZ5_9FIRM|nr:hypothetical protein [Veillonella montpellierensis]KGF47758.1 hypothetical protein HMPREF0872_03385 [Veillonella montpellierensis DNF00314]
MTITRTVTREHDNTLYALQKNDCNYALMKNGEMYYAVKKGATETVTLTLTPFEKVWDKSQPRNKEFWIAPFSATYKISGYHKNSLKEYSVSYKKGDVCYVTSEVYEKKRICHRDDCEWRGVYCLSFNGQLFSNNHVTITLNGYMDNEGTFYAELPSDAITKE